MLARLDRVPGVKESRVDWTGRYFLLCLDPGAAADVDAGGRVAAEAAKALGPDAVRLEGGAAAAHVEAFRRGEPWMRAGETLRLSRAEASILAARWARRAADAVRLDAEQESRLAALLEEEVAAAFERIHASGKPPDERFAEEGAALLARVESRARAFLSEDQTKQALAALRTFRSSQ